MSYNHNMQNFTPAGLMHVSAPVAGPSTSTPNVSLSANDWASISPLRAPSVDEHSQTMDDRMDLEPEGQSSLPNTSTQNSGRKLKFLIGLYRIINDPNNPHIYWGARGDTIVYHNTPAFIEILSKTFKDSKNPKNQLGSFVRQLNSYEFNIVKKSERTQTEAPNGTQVELEAPGAICEYRHKSQKFLRGREGLLPEISRQRKPASAAPASTTDQNLALDQNHDIPELVATVAHLQSTYMQLMDDRLKLWKIIELQSREINQLKNAVFTTVNPSMLSISHTTSPFLPTHPTNRENCPPTISASASINHIPRSSAASYRGLNMEPEHYSACHNQASSEPTAVATGSGEREPALGYNDQVHESVRCSPVTQARRTASSGRAGHRVAISPLTPEPCQNTQGSSRANSHQPELRQQGEAHANVSVHVPLRSQRIATASSSSRWANRAPMQNWQSNGITRGSTSGDFFSRTEKAQAVASWKPSHNLTVAKATPNNPSPLPRVLHTAPSPSRGYPACGLVQTVITSAASDPNIRSWGGRFLQLWN